MLSKSYARRAETANVLEMVLTDRDTCLFFFSNFFSKSVFRAMQLWHRSCNLCAPVLSDFKLSALGLLIFFTLHQLVKPNGDLNMCLLLLKKQKNKKQNPVSWQSPCSSVIHLINIWHQFSAQKLYSLIQQIIIYFPQLAYTFWEPY
jgi:hypothetical protein